MGKFSILILTVGIPGSGKTSWVKEYKSTHPLVHIVSTDDIREDLFGTRVCIPAQNQTVYEEARKRVKAIITNPSEEDMKGIGPEIIVDSTNVDFMEWIKYKELGPSIIIAKVFEVEPEEAWGRQQNRLPSLIVPFEILLKKWGEYTKNKRFLPHIFNMII